MLSVPTGNATKLCAIYTVLHGSAIYDC